MDPERRAAWFANWRGSPVEAVVAHVPFIVNSASGDAEAWERSRRRLVEEVHRADNLGVSAVVLHPGAAGDSPRAEGFRRTVAAIGSALDETSACRVRILIENMAGQGTTLCGRFEEIAELLELVGETERVGVCLDTAHAFIAGYPMVGYAGYDEVIAEFDAIVGLDRIGALHVNDALTIQGSRHDRHAAVGHGHMGLEVFHALMRDQRFRGVPMVLEVPDRDGQSLPTLELLRELKTREEPLEPEPGRAIQLALAPGPVVAVERGAA
jgi:deoxyribonuclease-4